MDTNLVNKLFTKRLQELLTQGYAVATDLMGGHQGEIAKVCFEKDGKFYALYAKEVSNLARYRYKTGDEPWGDAVELIFGEAEVGFRKGWTLWLSHLQVIDTTRIYIIGERYGRGSHTYTTDRDEAVRTWELRLARQERSWYEAEGKRREDDAAISAAFHCLKKRDGYKILRKHNVLGVKIKPKGNGFAISAEVRNTRMRAPAGSVLTVELFHSHDAALVSAQRAA